LKVDRIATSGLCRRPFDTKACDWIAASMRARNVSDPLLNDALAQTLKT
jgi:hypothetical protein